MNAFRSSFWLVALLSAALPAISAENSADAESSPANFPSGRHFRPGDVPWVDAPASLPPGTKMAVLEGDPKQPGLFTMRLKAPAGSKVLPHWHPRDERVTVLSGAVAVGFGAEFDLSKTRRFPRGSYYVNPPNVHHFVYIEKESVLQLTGEGPWEIHFLEPPAAPKNDR